MTTLSIPTEGGWIETYSGEKVHPLNAKPETIRLPDIAHALSLMCRYNGHCKHFYSVAQHSLTVAKEMKKDGYSVRMQFYGLMHDATEAYLADMTRPVKHQMPEYIAIEERLHKVIWDAFMVPAPTDMEWVVVKHYDDAVLAAEAKQLVACNGWNTEEPIVEADVSFMPMEIVEMQFMQEALSLLVEVEKEKL